MAITGLVPQAYIVGLCTCKLVYKPHDYYSYKYQVPQTIVIGVMFANLAIVDQK